MNARPLLVAGHERSGTHVLAGALTRAFGYAPDAVVDFDFESVNINYFDQPGVAETLREIGAMIPARIVTSHHAMEFFDRVLDDLLARTAIVYIHRHPVDVMMSFWRFVQEQPWREGPRAKNATAFAGAAPEGRLMRYQTRQRKTMLERWSNHVTGWTAAARAHRAIVVARYDDLDRRPEETMHAIAEAVGLDAPGISPSHRPAGSAGAPPNPQESADRDALHALALAEVGDSMRLLGYA